MTTDLLSRLSRLAVTYPTPGVQDTVRDAVAEIERLRTLLRQVRSEGVDDAWIECDDGLLWEAHVNAALGSKP